MRKYNLRKGWEDKRDFDLIGIIEGLNGEEKRYLRWPAR